jgi:hypothetical protein
MVIEKSKKGKNQGNKNDYLYTLWNRVISKTIMKNETEERDYKVREYYATHYKETMLLFLSKSMLIDSLLKVGFRFSSNLQEYSKVL